MREETDPDADRWDVDLMSYVIQPVRVKRNRSNSLVNLCNTEGGQLAANLTKEQSRALLSPDAGAAEGGDDGHHGHNTHDEVPQPRNGTLVPAVTNAVDRRIIDHDELVNGNYKVIVTLNPGTDRNRFTFGASMRGSGAALVSSSSPIALVLS